MMFAPDPDVLEVVGRRVDTLVATISDALARERLRKRIEGCRDEVVAVEMLRRLPRARWLARLVWKARARRAGAECVANGVAGLCAHLRADRDPYAA